MNVNWAILLCLVLVSCAPGNLKAQGELTDAARDLSDKLPVFPGAEGFGTDTVAGRGGRAILVTNLDESGEGSLRSAIEFDGPRTILFEVAGTIHVTRDFDVNHPFVTIAGESAPPPGITITGAGIRVHTHDVLISHVAVRVGGDPEGPDPGGRDGIGIDGPDSHHVVIDHCSVSFAVDEGMSTWNVGPRDITVSNCIVAENLSESIHPEGEHSKGFLIGDHTRRIAVLRNLFAHNTRRSPFVKGDVSALIANNVIYNPGTAAIHFGDQENSGRSLGTVASNVFIPGADTSIGVRLLMVLPDVSRGTHIYRADNVTLGARLGDAWFPPIRNLFVDEPPVWVTPLEVLDSAETLEHVLANAGARCAGRDEIDARVIQSVRERTGRIIDSVGEVGGLPETPLVRREIALPENPSADDDDDGYTNLEELLFEMRSKIEDAEEEQDPKYDVGK
ncbi:MAG: right-handed parallel beta-helix repeat-containing protein [Planctomycetes bacterium]|nr:right-handed parallel beta-helix repeat-containing protein [Planctomycetota bacterium]